MTEQEARLTFAMKPGCSNVFAVPDTDGAQASRNQLYRRGWKRVSRSAVIRTIGSSKLLEAALSQCGPGEIERVSELGDIQFRCHGNGAMHAKAPSTVVGPAEDPVAA